MSMPKFSIFVSSPQVELKAERHAVKDAILGNPLLHRYIDEVFLFEDLPAQDRRTDHLYLDKVKRCDIYLAILGRTYGHADKSGICPTEREFDHATKLGKTRLVFVFGKDEGREEKMNALVRRASREVVRRRAPDLATLNAEIYSALVEFLAEAGVLLHQPFDARPCARAALRDLSVERMAWFVQQAREERGFPLKTHTAPRTLLTHLNLLHGVTPVHAALLLFSPHPRRFIPGAEVKCVHFHGTKVERPVPDQKNFQGDIFVQADQARDFVLSKLARSRGVREKSSAASAKYEIPPDAVFEAIVNAVCHRDYNSTAAVEVRVFSDRVEVWNPGRLPANLTVALLRQDHSSVPSNPLLADPLYQVRYIERLGTGVPMMIEKCREAELPAPDFEQRGGSFVVTLWRDWLTKEALAEVSLNQRQREALLMAKSRGRLLVSDFRKLLAISKPTASRDLEHLVRLGFFVRVGKTGRGTYYTLNSKGLIKGSKGSCHPQSEKDS